MVGVAVKVTLVPKQMVCAPAVIAILTLAGKFGITVIVTEFEEAGESVKHGEALDVIKHVTISLFAIVVEVNVALLVPTFDPLTFH